MGDICFEGVVDGKRRTDDTSLMVIDRTSWTIVLRRQLMNIMGISTMLIVSVCIVCL